jgi:hypothetical protein
MQVAKTKAFSSLVRRLFKSCTKKLVRIETKLSDSKISKFLAELSDKCAVHLRSEAITLDRSLLLDCLDISNRIIVNFESPQSNTNMLLHTWLGGHWE